jgi:hypothetical protein
MIPFLLGFTLGFLIGTVFILLVGFQADKKNETKEYSEEMVNLAAERVALMLLEQENKTK